MCRLYVFLSFLLYEGCQFDLEKKKEIQATASSKNHTEVSNRPDGMVIFRKHCVLCHGADGKLGLNGAKDLTLSKRPAAERVELVVQGKNLMPSFEKILTPAEIEAVVQYTVSLSSNPAQ